MSTFVVVLKSGKSFKIRAVEAGVGYSSTGEPIGYEFKGIRKFVYINVNELAAVYEK